eukprot:TRINITY_DN3395_c0_g1_i1.p1 TRINITY_DN3395_c0_g1~~TRINITY_DN3395_c0_g1_i1.p1  ORF type:complete len:916 (-),score=94.39 TRINITY_DN3395_c0_g1_i1:194-2941(-)
MAVAFTQIPCRERNERDARQSGATQRRNGAWQWPQPSTSCGMDAEKIGSIYNQTGFSRSQGSYNPAAGFGADVATPAAMFSSAPHPLTQFSCRDKLASGPSAIPRCTSSLSCGMQSVQAFASGARPGALTRSDSAPNLVGSTLPKALDVKAIELENQRLREEIRAMCGTIQRQSGKLSKLWSETYGLTHAASAADAAARANGQVSTTSQLMGGRGMNSYIQEPSAPGLAGSLGRYPSDSRLPLFKPSLGPRPPIKAKPRSNPADDIANVSSMARGSSALIERPAHMGEKCHESGDRSRQITRHIASTPEPLQSSGPCHRRQEDSYFSSVESPVYAAVQPAEEYSECRKGLASCDQVSEPVIPMPHGLMRGGTSSGRSAPRRNMRAPHVDNPLSPPKPQTYVAKIVASPKRAGHHLGHGALHGAREREFEATPSPYLHGTFELQDGVPELGSPVDELASGLHVGDVRPARTPSPSPSVNRAQSESGAPSSDQALDIRPADDQAENSNSLRLENGEGVSEGRRSGQMVVTQPGVALSTHSSQRRGSFSYATAGIAALSSATPVQSAASGSKGRASTTQGVERASPPNSEALLSVGLSPDLEDPTTPNSDEELNFSDTTPRQSRSRTQSSNSLQRKSNLALGAAKIADGGAASAEPMRRPFDSIDVSTKPSGPQADAHLKSSDSPIERSLDAVKEAPVVERTGNVASKELTGGTPAPLEPAAKVNTTGLSSDSESDSDSEDDDSDAKPPPQAAKESAPKQPVVAQQLEQRQSKAPADSDEDDGSSSDSSSSSSVGKPNVVRAVSSASSGSESSSSDSDGARPRVAVANKAATPGATAASSASPAAAKVVEGSIAAKQGNVEAVKSEVLQVQSLGPNGYESEYEEEEEEEDMESEFTEGDDFVDAAEPSLAVRRTSGAE